MGRRSLEEIFRSKDKELTEKGRISQVVVYLQLERFIFVKGRTTTEISLLVLGFHGYLESNVDLFVRGRTEDERSWWDLGARDHRKGNCHMKGNHVSEPRSEEKGKNCAGKRPSRGNKNKEKKPRGRQARMEETSPKKEKEKGSRT